MLSEQFVTCMETGLKLSVASSRQLKNVMQPIILEITGTVVSLKNSRRLVRKARTGKPFSIKSADAERWMRDFVIQVPERYRGLKLGNENQLLRAVVTIWYPSLRSDV